MVIPYRGLRSDGPLGRVQDPKRGDAAPQLGVPPCPPHSPSAPRTLLARSAAWFGTRGAPEHEADALQAVLCQRPRVSPAVPVGVTAQSPDPLAPAPGAMRPPLGFTVKETGASCRAAISTLLLQMDSRCAGLAGTFGAAVLLVVKAAGGSGAALEPSRVPCALGLRGQDWLSPLDFFSAHFDAWKTS